MHVCSGSARNDQSGGDVAGTTSTTADRKWTSGDGGTTEGRTPTNVGIVPDNQQLFVGNLPHNVDDEELVKFFTSELTCVFTLECHTFYSRSESYEMSCYSLAKILLSVNSFRNDYNIRVSQKVPHCG